MVYRFMCETCIEVEADDEDNALDLALEELAEYGTDCLEVYLSEVIDEDGNTTYM